MKLKVTENGNVAAIIRHEVSSHLDYDNRSWFLNTANTFTANTYKSTSRNYNSRYNSNYGVYDQRERSDTFENTITIEENNRDNSYLMNEVCNRQFRLNAENNKQYLKSLYNKHSSNLAGHIETAFSTRESFLENSNESPNASPVDEERPFEYSDTDEMSESGVHPVPRGIVNPNYPGFQHLAHTLQDYSANIENLYPSENDMTDDDVELELTENSYDLDLKHNRSREATKNINNNNGTDDYSTPIQQTELPAQIDIINNQSKVIQNDIHNEIPDLLKTISKNNNNTNTISDYGLHCSDTDIENNFHTKDIIGDFNKEIEDEIKQLLNYNINIQDDLEELRKDIKDTFAKPIENTINNISDVVNHVIKKLVETQSDSYEHNEISLESTINTHTAKSNSNLIEENKTNTRTEMDLSRPTFLLIDNNAEGIITDAFLSDAKDEISINENEYDTEALGNNVEKTIQQLSTELRKIIPKLDEMRERDKLWTENKRDLSPVTKDGNSNEIANTSKCYTCTPTTKAESKSEVCKKPIFSYAQPVNRKIAVATRIEPRLTRDRQKDIIPMKSSYRSAQNKTSVLRNDVRGEYNLDSFDVYNIETALPKLDLDAIESHLKAAKEAERRKRNDREEIRRRLAMGVDTEDYYSLGHLERPGKKPSLHSRLQNGMNLQVCFMNETASDNESQSSDIERNSDSKYSPRSNIFTKSNSNHPYQTRPLSVNITKHDKISTVQSGAKLRPTSLLAKTQKSRSSHSLGHIELNESNFFTLQATLQTEARIALAQAKELARVQMERERRSRAVSPVSAMLRRSMEKAGAPLAPDRRRVSRHLLTDMNIAQLQVIVNELHSQIESLNDSLVKLLMARDELHMSQDSMLVDIEDLTRYLGVKEQTKKTKGTTKSGVRRLTSLVHK